MWLKAAGVEGIDPGKGPRFDVSVMELEAAAMGRGVALAPRGLVQEDIHRGCLAAPFSLTLELDCRVDFVCLPHALERPPVAAFRDWARAQAVATLLPPEDVVLS